MKPESVDYIFTDPPYGSHIAYLDLAKMWNAWLGFDVTTLDADEETIEDGDARHSAHHFRTKLTEGIGQMFRVLKYGRWMSIVFAHREPAMWDTIVKAAEAAGFEYVNTVAQPLNVIWSMHKKKNPLTVFSGELILNFRKIRNPRTIAITCVGCDAFGLIKDSAELTIVARGGATTDQIHIDLIPKLLENGLLGEVSSKIGDITPLLGGEFDYDTPNKTWHVRPGRKLGHHIPLDQRIKFYTVDFLNQQFRMEKRSTIDDILLALLPKLKNGEQPRKQRVLSEIRKIAAPLDGKYWTLQQAEQSEFEFVVATNGYAGPGVSLSRPEDKYEHNEMLLILARLGHMAGFKLHIGKKEQASSWAGEKLSKWVDGDLNFMRGAERFTRARIEQIDLLWLDGGRPQVAFEVEHTTAITTGLDRFIELLKVDREIAEKSVIVAPKSRRRKMNEVLSGSHYIGAPMYMESKVRYLWYTEAIQLARYFSDRRFVKTDLIEALMPLLHTPEVTRR